MTVHLVDRLCYTILTVMGLMVLADLWLLAFTLIYR